MQFKNLSTESFIKNVRSLKESGVQCFKMPLFIFYKIEPNTLSKEIKLKKNCKPDINVIGLYSNYHNLLKRDGDIINRAQRKMIENRINAQPYSNPEASLKLHINLNNIGELDESVLLGLIRLLIDEAESKENNMIFDFKTIPPSFSNDSRFRDTDQITVYFDKYSSVGDIIRLSKKVENFLLAKGVPENKKAFGPKDQFGFNSFVSARFDTNKLLDEYSVYAFFDLELEKFFKSHEGENLDHIPLCAFEAVFNTLITSTEIKNLLSKSNKGLSDEDSKKIQQELSKVFADPIKYITTSLQKGNNFDEGLSANKSEAKAEQNNEFSTDENKDNYAFLKERHRDLPLIKESPVSKVSQAVDKIDDNLSFLKERHRDLPLVPKTAVSGRHCFFKIQHDLPLVDRLDSGFSPKQ